MKIVKILNWILRAIVLILVVVLTLNNLQETTFNFLGIYTTTLPLILIVLIFLILGVAVGFIISFFRSLELRAKISMLEKELKAQKTSSKSIQNIEE